MATDNLEDLFLADDLEADGMPDCADWVRTSPHEEVLRERDGLLRGLGRYGETSDALADPNRRQDLELSDRLEALGCDLLAEEIRMATHDEVGSLVMSLHQLLVRASSSAQVAGELLELVTPVYVLSCTWCDGTGPLEDSGRWGRLPEGKLICPDCRQDVTS
jgi:hypothetical protein